MSEIEFVNVLEIPARGGRSAGKSKYLADVLPALTMGPETAIRTIAKDLPEAACIASGYNNVIGARNFPLVVIRRGLSVYIAHASENGAE
jgi:hypothetical protein